MFPAPPLLEVLPTRVRRNYTGGALLERWAGSAPEGRDGDMPEDWIASTVVAKNPGLPFRAAEGITRIRHPSGEESDLRIEIARQPGHFLGVEHLRTHGEEIGFLAKLLDSSIRLHIQAHPTAAFSRQHLNSPYGKLEAYVILGVRAGVEPYVLLGFKEAPSPAEWRRIIAEQDLPAMHARLHRLPIAPGEVWLVPGGLPHAIGEGVLMLEVMEPSDWVVRCEFERAGIVVPPEARFMGRDLDFCLNIFDYRSCSQAEIRQRCRLAPRIVWKSDAASMEELVGPDHTDCFNVQRLRAHAPVPVPHAGTFRLLLVTAGAGTLRAGLHVVPLAPGRRLLLPAGSEHALVQPTGPAPVELLLCRPGTAVADGLGRVD